MVADKGHKSAALQNPGGDSIAALFDELQLLMFRASHGKNQPAPFGKLGEERFRNGGGGKGHEEGVRGGGVRAGQGFGPPKDAGAGGGQVSQPGRPARSKVPAAPPGGKIP